jgi:NADH:ubiquinone oxidoreductase subunit E
LPSLAGRKRPLETKIGCRSTLKAAIFVSRGHNEMEEKLERILTRYRENEGNLISILQDIESEFGYLREDAITWVSDQLDIPPAKFYGVATFYAQFHLKPKGKNVITACCGTACHVKGSERLINSLVKELAIPAGEDTSEDLNFTVEKVNCVGACSIAPVIIINKTVQGKMTPDKLKTEIKTLKEGKREYTDYI